MNIIEKIKEIFKSKSEEKKEEDISIQGLENWLHKNLENTEKNLKERSEELYKNLLEMLEKLEDEIKILEKFDISKRKEHEKIKQITELGKKEYIQTLNKLIKKLRERRNIPYIAQEIKAFAQSSAKSHFKATQLIGKEVENITNTIARIRLLENDFLKENHELIQKNNVLKNIIIKNIQIKSAYEKKENIEKQKEQIEKSVQEKEKKIKDLEIKIKKIKEGPEAKEKYKLINEKKSTEDSLKSLEHEIKLLVDRRILEKYLYVEQDKANCKLTQAYLENPIETLISDEDFLILKLLQNAKEKIENGEIKLKDPRKAIGKIIPDKDVFLNYKNRIINIKEKIKYLEGKIENTSIDFSHLESEKLVFEKNIEENKGLMGNLLKKHNGLENEINKRNSELIEELKNQRANLILYNERPKS